MTGIVDYEKFSERREQKTPKSIHKMVPHEKWAFTQEVEEKKRDCKKTVANLEIVKVCNRGHVGHAEWTTRT